MNDVDKVFFAIRCPLDGEASCVVANAGGMLLPGLGGETASKLDHSFLLNVAQAHGSEEPLRNAKLLAVTGERRAAGDA